MHLAQMRRNVLRPYMGAEALRTEKSKC